MNTIPDNFYRISVKALILDEKKRFLLFLEENGITEFEHKRIGQAIFDRRVLGRHENHLFVLYEIYSDQKPIAGSELESMHWFSKEKLAAEIKDNPKEFGDAFYFVFKRFYPQLVS